MEKRSGTLLFLAVLMLLSISNHVQAQRTDENIRISGWVTDADSNPLPGVTVRIKGSSTGTVTNAKGQFGIRMQTSGQQTLRFSFVGFKTVERSYSQSTTNEQIVLKEDIQSLNEVVVTGYNVKKTRTAVVGSIGKLDEQELQPLRPEPSFEQLLEGKVAGVTITNTAGGDAGRPISVRIRGQGSLPSAGMRRSTSSEPLYILDGVPLQDASREASRLQQGYEEILNPLAALDPSDIESISILKDASASAIYGANAANGVVIITTKKGSAEKASINLNFSRGVAQPINPIKLLNSEQYRALRIEALVNDGATLEETQNDVPDTNTNTDWNDLLLQNADYTKAFLSVSGGNKNMNARVSANYLKQETISKGNDFQKFGIRSSLGLSPNEYVEFRLNSGLTGITKEMLGGFGHFNLPPNLSPYTVDGQFSNSGIFENAANPLAVLEQNENKLNSLATTNSLSLTLTPLENLRIRALAGADYYMKNQRMYRSELNATGNNSNGKLSETNRQNLRWITNLTANYSWRINNENQLDFMAGFEAQEEHKRRLNGTAGNLYFDDLRVLQASAPQDQNSNSFTETNSTLSYFGEISYARKDKYFLSLNSRSDGSSVFGGDVRRALFASLGAGWIVSKEEFFQSEWIDFLKLKASYGNTGNSRIGSYAARGLYDVLGTYNYNNQAGITPSTPENRLLTWEKNYKSNIGLDVHFAERFEILLEYYQNNIIDAIATIDIPHESGFNLGEINAANMRNSGLEFTLSYEAVQRKNLSWNISANASANRNVVTKLNLSGPYISQTKSIGYVIGEDIRTIYGVKYAGVDPENGRALWTLPEGTTTYDWKLANRLENRQPIGSRNPALFGGMTNTVNYKNFSLTLVNSYSFGSDKLISNFYEMDGRQIDRWNQSINLLDRWQQPGDLTNVPRLSFENTRPYINTDKYLYDIDYIQFDNLMLQYRFTETQLKRFGMSSINVFMQCNNLGYIYFDDSPKDRNGIAEYRFDFPEARTFTAGINVKI